MTVRIGLGLANFGFSSPSAFWRWVDLCEASDVDSLWQNDRLVSEQPSLETLSVMAALAGATERLKFGMNVVVVPFRDPLVVAKQCATIDFLSGGRLLPAFGVGGPVAPEWRATGRSLAGRGALADEALALIARLWAGERVTCSGEHFHYTDVSIRPLPVQQPLPLWIGGSSRAAIRRTARLGSGWLGGLQSPDQVRPVVAAIRTASADAGRPLDADHYGAGFPFRFGDWDEPVVQRSAAALARRVDAPDVRRLFAVGDAATILERIDAYRRAGIAKFVLRPIAEGDTEIVQQTRRLLEEVLPVAHGTTN